MSSYAENPSQTVESKKAVDYLDPTREPEPSSMTGPGTHFQSTFDPALKKDAPQLPDTSSIAPQPAAAASAKEKLADTNSTMTTAQLQKAAMEGDPNGLTGATVVRKEGEGDQDGWSGRY